ncbi:16842_t:CDS:1, partial [Acaulospora morrowiae]
DVIIQVEPRVIYQQNWNKKTDHTHYRNQKVLEKLTDSGLDLKWEGNRDYSDGKESEYQGLFNDLLW